MTSGIFLGSNLPSVITDEIEDDWRREIAEDFLDVNLLCGPEVTARLLQDGQLECWELYIENVTSLCKFMIHFSPTSKHLVNVDIKTKDLKVHKKLRESAVTLFNNCSNIYSYVQKISSLL